MSRFRFLFRFRSQNQLSFYQILCCVRYVFFLDAFVRFHYCHSPVMRCEAIQLCANLIDVKSFNTLLQSMWLRSAVLSIRRQNETYIHSVAFKQNIHSALIISVDSNLFDSGFQKQSTVELDGSVAKRTFQKNLTISSRVATAIGNATI